MNLKELQFIFNDYPLDDEDEDYSINLTIARFCPNLKSLYTIIGKEETLRMIFNSYQQLESIKVDCDQYYGYLNENKILEVAAKCSPEKFHEIRIHCIGDGST